MGIQQLQPGDILAKDGEEYRITSIDGANIRMTNTRSKSGRPKEIRIGQVLNGEYDVVACNTVVDLSEPKDEIVQEESAPMDTVCIPKNHFDLMRRYIADTFEYEDNSYLVLATSLGAIDALLSLAEKEQGETD